jgi:peroxiredoxin
MRAAGPARLLSPRGHRFISSMPNANSFGSTRANRILRSWQLRSISTSFRLRRRGLRPLRIAISQGDPAPDALFETDDRDQLALHRFRGREVLLNFWQSWSAPCLTELARLQRLQEARREPPFIVAFHGGKNSNAFAEIRRRLGLSFALVQDSQQRIARRYGVRCWPTTITVDADARAKHIQFGIGHEQIRTPEQLEPAVRSA